MTVPAFQSERELFDKFWDNEFEVDQKQFEWAQNKISEDFLAFVRYAKKVREEESDFGSFVRRVKTEPWQPLKVEELSPFEEQRKYTSEMKERGMMDKSPGWSLANLGYPAGVALPAETSKQYAAQPTSDVERLKEQKVINSILRSMAHSALGPLKHAPGLKQMTEPPPPRSPAETIGQGVAGFAGFASGLPAALGGFVGGAAGGALLNPGMLRVARHITKNPLGQEVIKRIGGGALESSLGLGTAMALNSEEYTAKEMGANFWDGAKMGALFFGSKFIGPSRQVINAVAGPGRGLAHSLFKKTAPFLSQIARQSITRAVGMQAGVYDPSLLEKIHEGKWDEIDVNEVFDEMLFSWFSRKPLDRGKFFAGLGRINQEVSDLNSKYGLKLKAWNPYYEDPAMQERMQLTGAEATFTGRARGAPEYTQRQLTSGVQKEGAPDVKWAPDPRVGRNVGTFTYRGRNIMISETAPEGGTLWYMISEPGQKIPTSGQSTDFTIDMKDNLVRRIVSDIDRQQGPAEGQVTEYPLAGPDPRLNEEFYIVPSTERVVPGEAPQRIPTKIHGGYETDFFVDSKGRVFPVAIFEQAHSPAELQALIEKANQINMTITAPERMLPESQVPQQIAGARQEFDRSISQGKIPDSAAPGMGQMIDVFQARPQTRIPTQGDRRTVVRDTQYATSQDDLSQVSQEDLFKRKASLEKGAMSFTAHSELARQAGRGLAKSEGEAFSNLVNDLMNINMELRKRGVGLPGKPKPQTMEDLTGTREFYQTMLEKYKDDPNAARGYQQSLRRVEKQIARMEKGETIEEVFGEAAQEDMFTPGELQATTPTRRGTGWDATFAEKNIPVVKQLIADTLMLPTDSKAFGESDLYDGKYPIPKKGGLVAATKSKLYKEDPDYKLWVDGKIKEISSLILIQNNLLTNMRADLAAEHLEGMEEVLKSPKSDDVWGEVDEKTGPKKPTIKGESEFLSVLSAGDPQDAWFGQAFSKYAAITKKGDISMREAFQNAIDATQTAIDDGTLTQGEVSIELHGYQGYTIIDNGIGMSAEDISQKFLKLYASGKREGKGRFGRFGTGKAIQLAPAPDVAWSIHSRDAYTDNEMTSEGVKVALTHDTRQGTRYEIRAPQSGTSQYGILSSYGPAIMAHSTETPKNITVKFRDPFDNWNEIPKNVFGTALRTYDKKINPETTVRVTLYKKPKIRVLESKYIIRIADPVTGIKLTQAWAGLDTHLLPSDDMAIVVDLETTSAPSSGNYPMNDNRLTLTPDADTFVQDVVKRNSKRSGGEDLGDKNSGGKHRKDYHNRRITDLKAYRDVINRLSNSPEHIKNVERIAALGSGVGIHLDPQALTDWMIDIERGYKGYRGGSVAHINYLMAMEAAIKISAHATGIPRGTIGACITSNAQAFFKPWDSGIMIDPINFPQEAMTSPESMAVHLMSLSTHELTHEYERGHGEDFMHRRERGYGQTHKYLEQYEALAEIILGKPSKATLVRRKIQELRGEVERLTLAQKSAAVMPKEQLDFWEEQGNAKHERRSGLYFPKRKPKGRQKGLFGRGGLEGGAGGKKPGVGERDAVRPGESITAGPGATGERTGGEVGVTGGEGGIQSGYGKRSETIKAGDYFISKTPMSMLGDEYTDLEITSVDLENERMEGKWHTPPGAPPKTYADIIDFDEWDRLYSPDLRLATRGPEGWVKTERVGGELGPGVGPGEPIRHTATELKVGDIYKFDDPYDIEGTSYQNVEITKIDTEKGELSLKLADPKHFKTATEVMKYGVWDLAIGPTVKRIWRSVSAKNIDAEFKVLKSLVKKDVDKIDPKKESLDYYASGMNLFKALGDWADHIGEKYAGVEAKQQKSEAKGIGKIAAKVVTEERRYKLGWRVLTNLYRMGKGGEKIGDASLKFIKDRAQAEQHDLYRLMVAYDSLSREIPTVDKLRHPFKTSDKVSKKMFDMMEGKVRPKTDGERAAYSIIKGLRDEIAEEAKKMGLKIGTITGDAKEWVPREDYAPVEYTNLRRFLESKSFKHLRDMYIETVAKRTYPEMYKLDKDRAILMAEDNFRSLKEDMTGRKFGHLEFERVLDESILKELEAKWNKLYPKEKFPLERKYTFDVWVRYLTGSRERLAWVKAFGNDIRIGPGMFVPEKLRSMRLELSDPNYKYVEGIFQRYLKSGAPLDSRLVRGLRGIRTYQLTKLAFAFIPNSLQWLTNTVPKVDISTLPGTILDLAKYSGANGKEIKRRQREWFSKTGAQTYKHAFSMTMLDNPEKLSRFADIMLRVHGFSATENFNALFAAHAGAKQAIKVSEKLYEGSKKQKGLKWYRRRFYIEELKRAGLRPEDIELISKHGPLNAEKNAQELFDAAFHMRRSTQFLADMFHLPASWSTPFGRLMTQFKNFAYNQSALIGEATKDFGRFFNPKPKGKGGMFSEGSPTQLLKMMPLLVLAGALIHAFKKKVYPKLGMHFYEELTAGKSWPIMAFFYMANAGGLGLVMDIANAATFSGASMVDAIGGPTVSDIRTFFQSIADSYTEMQIAFEMGYPKWIVKRRHKLASVWLKMLEKTSPDMRMFVQSWFEDYRRTKAFSNWSRVVGDAYDRYRLLYKIKGPDKAEDFWNIFMDTQGAEYEKIVGKKPKKPTPKQIDAWWESRDKKASESMSMPGVKVDKDKKVGSYEFWR